LHFRTTSALGAWAISQFVGRTILADIGHACATVGHESATRAAQTMSRVTGNAIDRQSPLLNRRYNDPVGLLGPLGLFTEQVGTPTAITPVVRVRQPIPR